MIGGVSNEKGRVGMFKKVQNVEVMMESSVGALLGLTVRVYLTVGRKKAYLIERYSRSQLQEMKHRSIHEPVCYLTPQGSYYWRFEDNWYLEDNGLDATEVEALIRSQEMQLEKRIGEAKSALAAQRLPDGSRRVPLSSELRKSVWKRDGGTCQSCGATEDLQFDHIIPVSLGGANSLDNLQVMCTRCNLQKGTSI